MTARTVPRHRATVSGLVAVTGRRRRDRRRRPGGGRPLGPPLLVAALLAVTSAALTTTTEVGPRVPSTTGTSLTVDG